MAERGDRFLRQLFALDELLGKAGFPRFSPWWRETLTEFYRSGCRQAVIRKGRRVGASTIVGPRVAVCEALHGGHDFSPGDRAAFSFVSVRRGEAAKRVRNIEAILDTLRVGYSTVGDTISLRDYRVDFSVLTASHRTAVGDTCIGVWCDEVARWNDTETGANPAREVLASIRPTIATLPNARIWLVSSPLGSEDAHATAFDEGDSSFQRVFHGETWVINPTLSEAETRALEPDERVWLREYAAVPQVAVCAAFDSLTVAAAFRAFPQGDWSRSVGIVDASSGGGDAFTYAIAAYCRPRVNLSPWQTTLIPRNAVTSIDGKVVYAPDETDLIPMVDFDATTGEPIANPEYVRQTASVACFRTIRSFEGRFKGEIAGSEIVSEIAKLFKANGVTTVVGDQREALFLHSEFMRHELLFREIAWSNQSKLEAVTRVKRLLSEKAIVLPERPKLRKELANYSERITPSGSIVYSARGVGHDDEVSLLLTFAMAELERLVPGSPMFNGAAGRQTVSGR